MDEIFFVLKTAVATFVFIIIMQVKIADVTIEDRFDYWIRNSTLTEPLRQATQGGFVFMKKSYHEATEYLDKGVLQSLKSSDIPGKRKLMDLKRSLTYQKEVEVKKEQQKQVNQKNKPLESYESDSESEQGAY